MLIKSEMMKCLYSKYIKEFCKEEIVLGEGNLDAQIILVGEAPGRDEVRLSKPFVGMAGKNLDEFLSMLELKRSSIYITNVIKYRLSKVNPKTGRMINRPATKEDIDSSKKYLHSEINIIKPIYIVTLGNVALRAVTNDFHSSIGALHGKSYTKINDEGFMFNLYPLYHPASIIYNRNLKSIYIEDILRFKDEIKLCLR